MTAITNIEYRNLNSGRNFPFADDIVLSDKTSHILPADYFIDASIFPIDTDTPLYLKSLLNKDVVIATAGEELAHGTLDNGIVNLYDNNDRHIGMLICSNSVTAFGTFDFADDVVLFSPAVVFPQNYQCVRGFRLPDGSVVTGDVVFVGENGLQVTSKDLNGQKIITFDGIGVQIIEDCIKLNPAVKCIKYHQLPTSSPLRISRAGNTIMISTSYEVEELCKNIKDSLGYPDPDNPHLPMDEEVCPEPVPPVPPEPAPEHEDLEPCPEPEEHNGEYFILPVNSGIDIESVEEHRDPVFYSAPGGDIVELEEKTAQGLRLSLKGLL